MSKDGFAWSWADYEREKRKWEREQAAKAIAAPEQDAGAEVKRADLERVHDQPDHTPDRGGGSARAAVAPIEIHKGASVDAARQQRDVIGRRQEGSSPRTQPTRNASPFPPKAFDGGELIDLSTVPSAMELAQANHNARGVSLQDARPIRQRGESEVLCRCGGKGKIPGPVPAWFRHGSATNVSRAIAH